MNEQIGTKSTLREAALPPDAKLGPRRRVSARRWSAIGVVLVVAAVGAASWWSLHRAPNVQYLTQPVGRGSIIRTVTATGTVNPELTIIVGAYVSGTIQQLFCDYNTIVRAGQVCAKIDPRPYKAILDQYKGQLLRDQAALAKDQMDLSRYQKLAGLDSIARQQAEDQLYVVKQDEANVKLDEALVEGAELNLDYTSIISPVNGTVVSRAVTQGQTVASTFQTPTLFLIATDLTKMQVDTNTSESDIGGAKVGNSATFTVDAFPNRIFQGKVTQVRQSPQTVQNVVTFDAVVGVDNKDLALMPGMTASTRIIIDKRDDVLRVPNQALRYVPGGLTNARSTESATTPGKEAKLPTREHAQLWVLRGAMATQVSVVPGLDDDNFTEIIEGDLQPGDEVIVGEERGSQAARASMSAPRL